MKKNVRSAAFILIVLMLVSAVFAANAAGEVKRVRQRLVIIPAGTVICAKPGSEKDAVTLEEEWIGLIDLSSDKGYYGYTGEKNAKHYFKKRLITES